MSADILFSGLPDPRGLKARRHKPGSILSLIVLSLLSGRKGLVKDNQKHLKEDIQAAFKEPLFPLGDPRNGHGKSARTD